MKLQQGSLANLFRLLATMIEDGDSFEGSISYSCLDNDLDGGDFRVTGTYRIGNLDGQGGVVVLEKEEDSIS